ncbi:MAG: hypothetical protein B6U72_01050 [Candidatus Altiarchaeales archaeon ex4484_2]|nr:MAG: hypothetical protein B6U72_01050 [Candidatus Altiarchaeales archaeon ex4484_2]
MKDPLTEYEKEFEELVGDTLHEPYETLDPLTVGRMLFALAEERKSTNLVMKSINGKFDHITNRFDKFESLIIKLDTISKQLNELNEKLESQDIDPKTIMNISERDEEILDFVKKHARVCADDIQKEFKYRGRNAASARLSKLFGRSILEKEYVGRKVFYKLKS